jgi:hypothetical protein
MVPIIIRTPKLILFLNNVLSILLVHVDDYKAFYNIHT